MKTIISELEFNGAFIQLTQSDGFDTMINATEMAKLFRKRPNDWFSLPSTKSYLEAFKSDTRFSGITPVLTVKGNYSDGTRQGTWMHRWVALEFARWLDPGFAIWCNMKIDELLRTGFTTALQEERDRYNSLLPQANYCDEVLTYSKNLYSTKQICKDMNLGYSAKTLLKKLEDNKFIYRRRGAKGWFLSSPYDKLGYTKLVSVVVIDKHGNKHVSNKKKWTENGKYWIWSLINKL